MSRIAINGFGRIGRYLTRLLTKDLSFTLAVINARADIASLAHLLKYDSCHGTYSGDITHTENTIVIDGLEILVTKYPLGEWNWKEHDIDIVVESTGAVKSTEDLKKHIISGAKRVIVSAPSKGADATFVYGVNHEEYNPNVHHILSAASCTTNCLAPVVKVLHHALQIECGTMTTIHSYTMSQRILDGTHKDLRRARAANLSIIPTTTGAAEAVALVLPELQGKLRGMSLRVPTPTGSLIDFVCVVAKPTNVEVVNTIIKNATMSPSFMEVLGYSEEALVSIDYVGSRYACVVDALSTQVVGGTMVKVLGWYDNEASFTNQLLRLIKYVATVQK
ncbi:MAG: type I glyceraldehyde-3-phosphate dehydrogenase [Desulfovibrionaceae bacterium]